jgi:hypothetical protein
MSIQQNQSPVLNRADTGVTPGAAHSSTLERSGRAHNTAPTRFVEVDGTRFRVLSTAARTSWSPPSTPTSCNGTCQTPS